MNQLKKSAIVVVSTFVLLALCLLSLEFGGFVFYKFVLKDAQRKNVEILRGESKAYYGTGTDKDQTDISEIELLPYYLYRNRAGATKNGEVQHTIEGFRGPQRPQKKEEGILRIIAIGGSTTYGWLISSYRDTWPSQLEVLLSKKIKQKVEVLNAGLPAGTSAEALVSYMLRDQFFNPDIVIFHQGGNDAPPLFYENYTPDYSFFRSIEGGSLAPRPFEVAVLKSYFMRALYSVWLKNSKSSLLKTDPTPPATAEQALKFVKKNEPLGFQRNMETITRKLVQDDVLPIYFPYILAPKEVYQTIPEAMRYAEKYHEPTAIGLEKNKVVLKKLSMKYNVPYFELSGNDIPLEDYFDHCHTKKEGDMIKAEFLAKAIFSSLEKKDPRFLKKINW